MKNEIANNLAGQAFKYAADHADEEGKGSLGVFAEKYAELILAEVDRMLSLQQDKSIEDSWNIDESFATVRNDIKEQFGVDE